MLLFAVSLSLFPLLAFLCQASALVLPRAAPSPPRLVQYVQTFKNADGSNVSLLPLLNDNTGVTHVILAAAHINQNPGDITLNDNPPNSSYYDFLWPQVKTLQQGGIKVLMLIGGAAQGSYTRLENTSMFDSYYLPLLSIIKYHNLDGLDLDIEESVPASVPLTLCQRLNADLGPSFLITMAPVASALLPIPIVEYGLSGFNYPSFDAQANNASRPNGKLVSWYNAQFYNGWGDASNQLWYDAIVVGGFASNRVVMGVLDTSADGGSGWVALSTLAKVIAQLRVNYASTGFGGVFGWEYFNAGVSDGLAQPYLWTKDVGAALKAATGGLPANLTSAPLSVPAVPWPKDVALLKNEYGASELQAVWALNRTDGNLKAASSLLPLAP